MKHPLPNGTIVRVTDYYSPVEVADYVSGQEADDGKPFYYLNSPQGYNDVIRDEGEILEVVATPEEARAKRVPTREQISVLLTRLCGAETDDLEIDEVERDKKEVTLFGGNEHGRRFAVTIPMDAVRIEETDF